MTNTFCFLLERIALRLSPTEDYIVQSWSSIFASRSRFSCWLNGFGHVEMCTTLQDIFICTQIHETISSSEIEYAVIVTSLAIHQTFFRRVPYKLLVLHNCYPPNDLGRVLPDVVIREALRSFLELLLIAVRCRRGSQCRVLCKRES